MLDTKACSHAPFKSMLTANSAVQAVLSKTDAGSLIDRHRSTAPQDGGELTRNVYVFVSMEVFAL